MATNHQRPPLDRRDTRPFALDHDDDTMSNNFASALGFDISGVYDEEEEPAKVQGES
jgi:hypothetical protein